MIRAFARFPIRKSAGVLLLMIVTVTVLGQELDRGWLRTMSVVYKIPSGHRLTPLDLTSVRHHADRSSMLLASISDTQCADRASQWYVPETILRLYEQLVAPCEAESARTRRLIRPIIEESVAILRSLFMHRCSAYSKVLIQGLVVWT